jgi:hypothetical protein
MVQNHGSKYWHCLRPALSAHTALALATWPVSATIANAGFTIINNKDLATSRKSWFRLYQRNQRNHSNQR